MKATTWIRTPGTSHKRQGGRSVGRDSGGLRRCQDLVCKSKLVDKSEAGGCDGGGGQVGQGREAEAGVKGGERREEKRGDHGVISHSFHPRFVQRRLARQKMAAAAAPARWAPTSLSLLLFVLASYRPSDRTASAKLVVGSLKTGENWAFVSRFCFLSLHGRFQALGSN